MFGLCHHLEMVLDEEKFPAALIFGRPEGWHDGCNEEEF